MKGFTKDGKFHPISNNKVKTRKKRLDYKDPELLANAGVKINPKTNQRMKRISHSELSDPNVAVKINKSMHNEGLRLKRYKRFIPRVTIKANKNRGEKEVANYTINLAGRGMYVVGTLGQAKEYQKQLQDSVQDYLKSGASFDKDGYVIYPKNAPMTDLNLDRRKP